MTKAKRLLVSILASSKHLRSDAVGAYLGRATWFGKVQGVVDLEPCDQPQAEGPNPRRPSFLARIVDTCLGRRDVDA